VRLKNIILAAVIVLSIAAIATGLVYTFDRVFGQAETNQEATRDVRQGVCQLVTALEYQILAAPQPAEETPPETLERRGGILEFFVGVRQQIGCPTPSQRLEPTP
jgi:hypothetical protein